MVPVIPVEVGGIRYLVSPYGESDWVRNVRTAGKATLARKGKVETFQASEIAVPGRAAIIAAYRKVCGRTVHPWFTKLPDPSDHPVFRVVEIGTSPAGCNTIPAGAQISGSGKPSARRPAVSSWHTAAKLLNPW